MWVRKYGLYDNVKDTGAISMGANATFINNYAFSDSGNAFGGVIYSDADISFSDGATFINNYAKTSGGAIELGGKLDLFALTKDVLFSGNMVGGVVIGQSDDGFPVVENGIANAIDMNGSLFSSLYTPNLTLAAEEGIGLQRRTLPGRRYASCRQPVQQLLRGYHPLWRRPPAGTRCCLRQES